MTLKDYNKKKVDGRRDKIISIIDVDKRRIVNCWEHML